VLKLPELPPVAIGVQLPPPELLEDELELLLDELDEELDEDEELLLDELDDELEEDEELLLDEEELLLPETLPKLI
jgi:hypothetical protein